ncbi:MULTISPECIES: hypothetical protein [Mycolicibacterium]|nr:hypothetical protein [Mycolicibacterium fortuitum]
MQLVERSSQHWLLRDIGGRTLSRVRAQGVGVAGDIVVAGRCGLGEW